MLRAVLAFMLVILICSCGGGKQKQKQESTSTKDTVTSAAEESPPIHMIPPEGLSEFEKLINAYIRPYFDDKASVTEKSVAPGETFTVYIFGEFNEMYPMAGAEYKLSLPEGLEYVYETKSDSISMTLGKYSEDLMLAFNCANGPKFLMVKYVLKATDAFSGGDIETQEGDYKHFLGFSLCDEAATMVRAMPGKATLGRKQ
jgi:hypothetical protein